MTPILLRSNHHASHIFPATSPVFSIGAHIDYRVGLEAFAEQVRARARARPPPAAGLREWMGTAPFGWNSWGAAQDRLTHTLGQATSRASDGTCSSYMADVVYVGARRGARPMRPCLCLCQPQS